MLVTDFTRQTIMRRRRVARLMAEGYEPIAENGAPLWKFQRGICAATGCEIVDAKVGPNGHTVFIKVVHHGHGND